MIEQEMSGGILYTGSPSDVLMAVARRITKALEHVNIPPTGIHLLGLLYVFSCALYNGRQSYNKGDTHLGVMPSYSTVLTFMTRVSLGENLSPEETQAFNEDLAAIVTSLGGSINQQPNATTPLPHGVIMSPLSKEIH